MDDADRVPRDLREGPDMPFRHHDGGRSLSGFWGETGDCGVRAVAIATGRPYREVYDALMARMKADAKLVAKRGRRGASPRNGAPMAIIKAYLAELGWVWVPTMGIGTGCTTHLTAAELPPGRLIVRLSKHLTAIIDGVIHDTYNPSRGGTRCVYGYFRQEGIS